MKNHGKTLVLAVVALLILVSAVATPFISRAYATLDCCCHVSNFCVDVQYPEALCKFGIECQGESYYKVCPQEDRDWCPDS